MKTQMKKIGLVSLAAVFAVASVMCCSFSGLKKMTSSKQVQIAKAMPSCHGNQSDSKSNVPTDGCACCLTKEVSSIPIQKISLEISQTVVSFLVDQIHELTHAHNFSDISYLNGPPGPVVKNPQYIQFHNLRI